MRERERGESGCYLAKRKGGEKARYDGDHLAEEAIRGLLLLLLPCAPNIKRRRFFPPTHSLSSSGGGDLSTQLASDIFGLEVLFRWWRRREKFPVDVLNKKLYYYTRCIEREGGRRLNHERGG